MTQQELINFILTIANLLRGPYRRVMIPLTMLRRLDCVLEPTKDKVLAKLSAGKLAAKERKAVDRLTEYRASLISHTVTGKIDVREEVAA